MASEALLEAIARARAKLEQDKPVQTYGAQVIAQAQAAKPIAPVGLVLNEKQQMAVDRAVAGHSFNLIGSAGTGKTTTTKKLIEALMAENKLPPLEKSTKWLTKDAPGVALIAYTRRAVRNIAKQMPEDFKSHCITYHKLVEYEPEETYVDLPGGGYKITKPFKPQRRPGNTLPANLRLIIIDEASMFSVDFWRILLRALPDPASVQFIFIGDIHQLPPIYGDGILGFKFDELPTVELTQVYRQALESPIIELALHVKDGVMPPDLRVVTKDWEKTTPRGSVKIIPWKKKLSEEEAEQAMHHKLQQWVKDGTFNVNEDVILCPWGKRFGTINMNKSIGTAYARQRGAEVYEVIAGYEKHYFSVGDRVMFDKRDAIIVKIAKNTRYIGKQPQPGSFDMDYWGWGGTASSGITEDLGDLDALLDRFADSEDDDRTHESSHAITIEYTDDDSEYIISKAGEVNICDLGYAISVHKSQGSEWRKVFIIAHDVHVKMMSRELTYTAITRASQELVIITPPTMLNNAAKRPRIKGNTLEEKIKWFRMKRAEQGFKLNQGADDEEEDA